jgi:hypothetical protein
MGRLNPKITLIFPSSCLLVTLEDKKYLKLWWRKALNLLLIKIIDRYSEFTKSSYSKIDKSGIWMLHYLKINSGRARPVVNSNKKEIFKKKGWNSQQK